MPRIEKKKTEMKINRQIVNGPRYKRDRVLTVRAERAARVVVPVAADFHFS